MSEILAPLGGLSDLPAALNTGADAVYLGLSEFSARKNAENFSVEELKTSCTECHKRGVKVYAALNTLVYDSEAEKFAECVKSAAECGVDGLIIQDLGAAEIAKRVCPKLPRHASTQMTLNSTAGVNAAQQLGFCRAVIGREHFRREERQQRSLRAALPTGFHLRGQAQRDFPEGQLARSAPAGA